MVFKLPRHPLPPPLALCKLGNIFSFTFTSCLWYSQSLSFVGTSHVKHLPTQTPPRREATWTISGIKKGQESSSSWTAWAEHVWIDRTNLHLLPLLQCVLGNPNSYSLPQTTEIILQNYCPRFPARPHILHAGLLETHPYWEKTLLYLNTWKLGQ